MNDDMIVSSFTENVSTTVPQNDALIIGMNAMKETPCLHPYGMTTFQGWQMCLRCRLMRRLYQSNWRVLHVDGFESKV